jgi:hypothetical protein
VGMRGMGEVEERIRPLSMVIQMMVWCTLRRRMRRR